MLYICYVRILFYFVEKPQGRVLVEQVFISQLWKCNQGVNTYGEQDGMCGVRNQDSLLLPFHYPQHSSSCFYLIFQEACLCSSCQCSSQQEVGKAEEKVGLFLLRMFPRNYTQ